MTEFEKLEVGDGFSVAYRDKYLSCIKVGTDDAFMLSGTFAMTIQKIDKMETVFKSGRVAIASHGRHTTY